MHALRIPLLATVATVAALGGPHQGYPRLVHSGWHVLAHDHQAAGRSDNGPASATTGVVLAEAPVLGGDGSAIWRTTYGAPGQNVIDVQRGALTPRWNTVVLTVVDDASVMPTPMWWTAGRRGSTRTFRLSSPKDGSGFIEVYVHP